MHTEVIIRIHGRAFCWNLDKQTSTKESVTLMQLQA